MNALKLNSISPDIFSFKSADNGNNHIRVCAADGQTVRTLDRDKIVAAGRLATLEYFGAIANADPHNLVKYNSKGAIDQKKVWEDTVLYCAAIANRALGREPYATMQEVAADRKLYKNQIFWAALAYISQDVIEPLYPAVIPAATERLIDWRSNGRLGVTELIDIESNDFFLFDDDSWGSVSSKPYQYLYKAQIALTPQPYTAKTKIKWYQDIVGGTAGRYYAAFMRGAYSKLYAMILSKFKKAVGDSRYIPTTLSFDSYTPKNWNQAIMMAAAINGVDRTQLMAMGTLAGLSNILPTVGEPAVAAGIQGMIGDEWVRNGFLGNVAGVDLIEAGLAVVPGTQNYEPKFVSLDDATSENIYIMAKVGRAPMAGVIAEGSPITISFDPRETADMTIDISETLVVDVQPAFSQKIVKMKVDQ